MKVNWDLIYNRDNRIPRKIKKKVFGVIPSKNKLRKRISNVEYDNEGYLTDYFCPKCGCGLEWSTRNLVEHPEVWIICRCLRCNEIVGGQDNSPPFHVLEENLQP